MDFKKLGYKGNVIYRADVLYTYVYDDDTLVRVRKGRAAAGGARRARVLLYTCVKRGDKTVRLYLGEK